MITSRYFVISMLLTVAAIVATVILYPSLPDHVVTHWDINNHPNGYSPKSVLFLLGPGFMVLIMGIMYSLPWLSPKRFEVDTFQSTYLYIMMLIVGILGYAYGIILWAGIGHEVNVGRAIVGGISLLFILMGNVMGKIRRNFYVGVRTPWALADDRVWNATHRFAAKIFVVAGIAGLVLAGFGIGGYLQLVPITCAALFPVAYSLIVYKRMERRGELEDGMSREAR
jgi:uncharacterized membrane protein